MHVLDKTFPILLLCVYEFFFLLVCEHAHQLIHLPHGRPHVQVISMSSRLAYPRVIKERFVGLLKVLKKAIFI